MSGYLAERYAESLSQIGRPIPLARSRGFLLQRPIPHSSFGDAVGSYPLFCCREWSRLGRDLSELDKQLVSIALVADPFGDYTEQDLKRWFDKVIPFKEHFVADLTRPIEEIVSSHHRRFARKGLRRLSTEHCADPLRHAAEWVTMYGDFVRERQIRGLAAFDAKTLEAQLHVPGLVMLRATHNQSTVGIHLWYECGDRAYAHLAAYNKSGYEKGASYVLFWSALEFFKQRRLSWLHLGGAPGIRESGSNGLKTFKEGWSTEMRTVYFCGRICDPAHYQELSRLRHSGSSDFFPAYRAPHFV